MTHEEMNKWRKFAEEQGLRDGVIAPCPCGRPVALGFVGDEATVLHPLPICEPYEKLEPDEYATYVRQAATKQLGGEVGA